MFKTDEQVNAEQQRLLDFDTLILLFPFHWYSLPGILKLWIDQVFLHDFAYGENGDKLKGKNVLFVITVGGPYNSYNQKGYNNYTTEELLAPIYQTFILAQTKILEPVICHDMIYIPGVYNYLETIKAKAEVVSDIVKSRFLP